MAKSKAQKEAMLEKYAGWLTRSKSIVLVEYTGLKMKDLDVIRAKARENGGEFHIVKNTLAKIALENAGYSVPSDFSANSTAIGFSFTDAASFAKGLTEATKGLEAVRLKGGFLEAQVLDANQVKSLASLPPLPAIRAQLLGVIQAPAGKLVRTLAEPGRSLASVLKAYSDKASSVAA